jgi:hypothetical protein
MLKPTDRLKLKSSKSVCSPLCLSQTDICLGNMSEDAGELALHAFLEAVAHHTSPLLLRPVMRSLNVDKTLFTSVPDQNLLMRCWEEGFRLKVSLKFMESSELER